MHRTASWRSPSMRGSGHWKDGSFVPPDQPSERLGMLCIALQGQGPGCATSEGDNAAKASITISVLCMRLTAAADLSFLLIVQVNQRYQVKPQAEDAAAAGEQPGHGGPAVLPADSASQPQPPRRPRRAPSRPLCRGCGKRQGRVSHGM